VSPRGGDGSLRKRSGRLFEDGQRRMNSVSSSGSLHSQPSGEAGAQQQWVVPGMYLTAVSQCQRRMLQV
jgi:hypothetical protein